MPPSAATGTLKRLREAVKVAVERPNTLSGLQATRAELNAIRCRLKIELRKVVCDLDHLDATIELFDPANTPQAIQLYTTKHRAQKGHVQRFVLKFMREAGRAVTSRELTEAWIADRGLRADDGTFAVLRKRIGACLIGLRADGLMRNGEGRDGYVGYELAVE